MTWSFPFFGYDGFVSQITMILWLRVLTIRMLCTVYYNYCWDTTEKFRSTGTRKCGFLEKLGSC